MNTSIIAKNIIRSSEEFLKDRKIKDLVIGLSLVGIEFDNGFIGLSYVHRDELMPECGAFGFAQNVIGMSAFETANWLVDEENSLKKSIASAVLCAGSQAQEIMNDNNPDKMFNIDFQKGDKVGMIGYIKPVAQAIKNKACEVYIFDNALSAKGITTDIFEAKRQKDLLPQCNKMVITGSSIVNNSIDGILELCSNAKEIVLVGTSTPMYAEAWKNTKVTALAGSLWKNDKKDEIFKIISLAGGIPHLHEYMLKKVMMI